MSRSPDPDLARRRRRRLIALTALAALAVLAYLFLQCGRGFGLGGGGSSLGRGSGTGAARPAMAPLTDAAPRRCALRLAADGITVDGKHLATVDAVAACKATAGADVTVTGDARQGDWDELRDALAAAGVTTFVRGAPTAAPDAAVAPEDAGTAGPGDAAAP